MATLKFNDEIEEITTRDEFPLQHAKEVLKNEVIAVLGYGIQGPAQALNLRDNGFRVIVGQRSETSSWQKALDDGWKPGVDLFSLEEACQKATFICFLLSDAGQMQQWPTITKFLSPGKTLLFSHGFSIVFGEKTAVCPPSDIDVVLVAPKGSGRSVRQLFLENRGINASYAIYQNASGFALNKVLAYGIGIGSGFLFPTSFKNEVYSDLTGERGALMGALAGLLEAQYEVLREHGHSPTEAFNETVEELTQSLMPLVAQHGMDWMYGHCSTTAQRGALDWLDRFKNATLPVFKSLYQEVVNGNEARRVIQKNSKSGYKAELNDELSRMGNKEIWQVGRVVRQLRPDVE